MKMIRKLIFVLIGSIVLSLAPAVTAYAASSVPSDMSELQRYQLDTVHCGITDIVDKTMNAITNFLFGIIKLFGWAVAQIFGAAMNQDLAGNFKTQINNILSVLKSTVFDTFFILAFCGAAFMLCKNMFTRNMQGVLGEMVKVVVIMILSIFVTTDASTALAGATNITQSLATGVLVDMNNAVDGGENDADAYINGIKGKLWQNLVYDHWYYLEFGAQVGDGHVDESSDDFQTLTKHRSTTDQRESAAETWPDTMGKSAWSLRMVYLVVYLIPFLIKSILYIAVAVIALAFQLMAIFYVLLAPVILLLALIPATGGFDLINTWLKKILETQLMIILITFLLGVIMITGDLFDNLCSGIGGDAMGRIVSMILQSIVSVLVVMNYKTMFKFLGKAAKQTQAAIRNPSRLRNQLHHSGNSEKVLGAGANAINSTARTIVKNVKNVINSLDTKETASTSTAPLSTMPTSWQRTQESRGTNRDKLAKQQKNRTASTRQTKEQPTRMRTNPIHTPETRLNAQEQHFEQEGRLESTEGQNEALNAPPDDTQPFVDRLTNDRHGIIIKRTPDDNSKPDSPADQSRLDRGLKQRRIYRHNGIIYLDTPDQHRPQQPTTPDRNRNHENVRSRPLSTKKWEENSVPALEYGGHTTEKRKEKEL